jgi:isoleucyl-tRNA synthetase
MSALIATFDQEQIAQIENNAETTLELNGAQVVVTAADFEITSEDMPGWLVASEGKLTVALDITITEELKREGVARELVNRIQNIRKESGFEVTDKIRVEIEANELTTPAIESFAEYIGQQTLAVEVKASAAPAGEFVVDSDIDEVALKIAVTKA